MLGTDPFSVVVSSVTLFVGEGALAAFFLLGLWRGALWAGPRLRLVRIPTEGLPGPRSERADARLVVWSSVFLAAWSVLFKMVVYGSSQGAGVSMFRQAEAGFVYANLSELVVIACVCVGAWLWIRGGSDVA